MRAGTAANLRVHLAGDAHTTPVGLPQSLPQSHRKHRDTPGAGAP
jgi:hypothetical protein